MAKHLARSNCVYSLMSMELPFDLSQRMVDKFSRKYSLIIGGLIMLLGNIVLASSYNVWMVILGRLISGFSLGILSIIPPIHVSELSPKEYRGTLTSIGGMAFGLGAFVALFANIGFSKFAVGWRLSLASVSLIAVIFVASMKFVPHSPRWLVNQHRYSEALLVLSKINNDFVDGCLELEVIRTNSDLSKGRPWYYQLKDLCSLKLRMFLVLFLFLINSIIGINILYYSTTLFCIIGSDPFVSSLVLSSIALAASFVLILFVDKFGRRLMFLGSSAINFILSLAIAILSQLFQKSNLVVVYVNVTLVCLYIFFLSCSWLTLVWSLGSEMFPTRVRGMGVAVSSAAYAGFVFFSNQLTPLILGFSLPGFFYIVSGGNLLASVVILLALPEMKGVSLEEIEEYFSLSCVKLVLRNLSGKESKSREGQLQLI